MRQYWQLAKTILTAAYWLNDDVISKH